MQDGVRFSLVQYSGQPSLEKSFSNGNDKLILLDKISGLKYQAEDARLNRGLEYIQDNIFSECKSSQSCSAPTKPIKALITFTDRELDDDSKGLLKKLGDAGLKVVVVVISDTLTKNTVDLVDDNVNLQIYPVDGGKGRKDDTDGEVDGKDSTSDGGDEIDNIVDQIERG